MRSRHLISAVVPPAEGSSSCYVISACLHLHSTGADLYSSRWRMRLACLCSLHDCMTRLHCNCSKCLSPMCSLQATVA